MTIPMALQIQPVNDENKATSRSSQEEHVLGKEGSFRDLGRELIEWPRKITQWRTSACFIIKKGIVIR